MDSVIQGWRNPTGPSDKSGKNWPGPMKMSMLPDQVSGEYSTVYVTRIIQSLYSVSLRSLH